MDTSTGKIYAYDEMSDVPEELRQELERHPKEGEITVVKNGPFKGRKYKMVNGQNVRIR